MAKLGRVQINPMGTEGGAQLVLTTENGDEHKFDLTMDGLIGLGMRLPRFVDAHLKAFRKTSDPDVEFHAMAPEATSVVTNEVMMGHRVLMTVEDNLRYPLTWTLTPELATTLGGELMRLGRKLADSHSPQKPS